MNVEPVSRSTDEDLVASARRLVSDIFAILENPSIGGVRQEACEAITAHARVLEFTVANGVPSPGQFRRTAYVLASLLMMNDDKKSFDIANELLFIISRSHHDEYR